MTGKVTGAVLLSIAVFSAIGSNEEAKAKKQTLRSHDGVNIVYESRGKGDTALIFLHGWCGDREYWKHQVGPFSKKYRVITLDQAGHGQSGTNRKKWTVNGLAKDVETLVKKLDLKRVILIGHSMGGPVALLAAKRMPSKVVAVIGVDTLNNAEFKPPKEVGKKFLKSFASDFKGTMRMGLAGMLHKDTDPKLTKWLTTRAAAQDKKMALALMKDLMAADHKVLLKNANVPVRCVNSGGGYTFFTPTAIKINKKYADYDAAIIDEVGHYPMLEKPAEFNQKLGRVLKEFATKR